MIDAVNVLENRPDELSTMRYFRSIVVRRSASQFTARSVCDTFVEHVFNVLENWLNWPVENVPHVILSTTRSVVPQCCGFAVLVRLSTPLSQR